MKDDVEVRRRNKEEKKLGEIRFYLYKKKKIKKKKRNKWISILTSKKTGEIKSYSE